MSRKRITTLLFTTSVISCCLLAVVQAGGEKGYRVWKTSDGKKSVVKMAFVSQTEKAVKLKREDNGRVYDIPISRLSNDDRKYIEHVFGGVASSKSAKSQSKSPSFVNPLHESKKFKVEPKSSQPAPSSDRRSPQIARSSPSGGDLRSRNSGRTHSVTGDWPQFLGPLRNGVQPDSTPLVDSLDRNLSPVWASENIPADKEGGFASPVVAGGRVFAFSSWRSGGSVEDVTLCLDARTGRTIWKKSYPSGAGEYGSSSTPCVAEGKVFVGGARGTSYCFDADSGRELWKTSIHSSEINSSFVYLDGRVFILADRLFALDAQTGEKLWEQRQVSGGRDSSPVVWTEGGATYIIAGNNGICCVRPQNGEVVWQVRGAGRPGSPVACGNTMVEVHNDWAKIYEISGSSANLKIEFTEGKSNGSTPVNDGSRIWFTGQYIVCVDANSGSILWRERGVGTDYQCPILADGKLLCLGHRGMLTMFDADTGRNLGRAEVNALRCSSAALAAGRLFVRTRDDVRCYDLRMLDL